MAEKSKSSPLVVIVIILLVLLLGAAGVVITMLARDEPDTPSTILTSEHGIGYEINAELLTSGEIAFSQPDGVAIKFSTAAFSSDGYNFSCKIANSNANTLDMYIGIYWDSSYEDELYLSGLMRPGEGIVTFKTNRQIPQGIHEVVLVPTLVEDDHMTIHAQSSVYLTLGVE